MSPPYVPGHIIDEAKDRRRQGDSLERLAGRIGISPEDLAKLLGEPQWKQVSPQQAADDFDLFASDRLDGVL
jgi:hypothetical protein